MTDPTPTDPPRLPRRRRSAPPEFAGPNQGAGRFPKGQSGNPAGKPKGARNHAARLLDELAAGAGERILKRLISRAGRSDVAAATILARIWPAPRGRAVTFKMPAIVTVADAAKAVAAVLKAASEGQLVPEEAEKFVTMCERYGRLIDASDLEKRIVALEQTAQEIRRATGR